MSQQFVLVRIADQRKLVRITDIQEIVPVMALADIEQRRGSCRGIANLRGETIPVFDLAGSHATLSPSRLIVISRAAGHLVGLVVDEVDDVVTIPDGQLALHPVGETSSAWVARLGDEVFAVLEPADVLCNRG